MQSARGRGDLLTDDVSRIFPSVRWYSRWESDAGPRFVETRQSLHNAACLGFDDPEFAARDRDEEWHEALHPFSARRRHAQPPGARRSAARDVRARDEQGRLLRSCRAFPPQASADVVGALFGRPPSACLRPEPDAGERGFTVGRDAVPAQRRRQDPVLEDGSGDALPRPQPGRRRAAVRPRGRGRVLLRLGPALLSRRRLHRDSARRHVAPRAFGADHTAADRVHRGNVYAPREGHRRQPCDLRSGDARRSGHGRGVPRAADRRPVAGGGEAHRRAVDDRVPVQSARCAWAGTAT